MDFKKLRVEIETDPTKLGYADLMKLGSDQGVADLLNTLTDAQINRGMISRTDFMYDFGFVFAGVPSIPSADVRAAWAWNLQLVLGTDRVNLAAAGFDGDLAASPPIVGVRQQAVASGLCTDDHWKSIACRPASRAEILFGGGIVVSSNDVAAAFGRI